MLIMSDLQLLTGMAIMVSGFAQLRCGLSTYHWQRIVNTAWFACVTHLFCLTFLRDHFLQNHVTQLWRVPGMVMLTTMVVYALTTTSQYDWLLRSRDSSVTRFDQAICYLDPSFDMDFYSADKSLRLICSIVSLVFGTINRLRRLFHAPNLIVTKFRNWTSQTARRFLMQFYGKGSAESFVACIAALLIYRPLLALFLLIRFVLDCLTSMAFEVRSNSPHKSKKTR